MELDRIEAPLALCSRQGDVHKATEQARHLLLEMTDGDGDILRFPSTLWGALQRTPIGSTLEWRRPRGTTGVFGCTRYRAGNRFLVLLSRLSAHSDGKWTSHSDGKRHEARLVASIAEDLRNSIATIVYGADFLSVASSNVPIATVRETANEMVVASRRLQCTVDGLLDYARLGPTISVPVSVREVVGRTQRILRTVYHNPHLEIVVTIEPMAEWARGNSLLIEQVLFNLLINAIEAGDGNADIAISARCVEKPESDRFRTGMVCVRVRDDGPGVPVDLRDDIFEPYFTTRGHGSGLGLAHAREAAAALGGQLVLEPTDQGACFAFYLPRGDRR